MLNALKPQRGMFFANPATDVEVSSDVAGWSSLKT